MTIFTSQYFAPISYYRAFLGADEVLIEQYNHYEKKTYQNRCDILTANGKIALSIPVEKSKNVKTPFKDVRIAYHEDWVKQHLRAIASAYKNSPFYEYYIDDFLPVYEKQHAFLIDFNMALHKVVMAAIDEQRSTVLTEQFDQSEAVNDLRFEYHPRKNDGVLSQPYYQVFSDKMDFVPNLSILDLLFNLGPEVELYLKG